MHTWLIIKKKHLGKTFSTTKSTDYTKFIILCTPRTGSNWLHTLLNSHWQIFSYGEAIRRAIESETPLNQLSLETLIYTPHQTRIKAVGFKLFYEYWNDPAYKPFMQEAIKDKGIKIIHLTRNNILAQYTSLQKAEKSEIWSRSANKEAVYSAIYIDQQGFELFKKE